MSDSKSYSVDLFVKGEWVDTFDWFMADESPEQALQQAQEDVEYRDQEWWDESYGYDDESLMGFTDWEIKIVRCGDWNE